MKTKAFAAVLALIFPIFLFSLPALPVDAALVPCGTSTDQDPASGIEHDTTQKCSLCHLIIGINTIITYIRNVMVFFAFAVLVAMGILYIVSTGDQGMMETAKNGIKAALFGIGIVLLAWIAINTLMFVVFRAKSNLGVGASIQGVNGFQFTCN